MLSLESNSMIARAAAPCDGAGGVNTVYVYLSSAPPPPPPLLESAEPTDVSMDADSGSLHAG